MGANSNYVRQLHDHVDLVTNVAHEDDNEEIRRSLSSLLLRSLSNEGLCDVEIVGRDEVPVEAPSYLLAVHSEVFNGMMKANANALKRVELSFADYDAISASVHFLATHALPEGLEIDIIEANVRTVCQVSRFGMRFGMPSLSSQADRMARRMINRAPPLACAAFDECMMLERLDEGEDQHQHTAHDELKEYALNYLRESPLETMMAGGTEYLSVESIKAIIGDHDMDVDEQTMFRILHMWVKQDEDENVEAGRAMVVSNINLAYLKTDFLNNVVRRCGFVEPAAVNEAMREIEELSDNRSPDEMEHVLVEGAGIDEVNGVYLRIDEDIGMKEEDVVYVKEAPEDGTYYTDYALFLFKSKWAITTCVDSSNVLYSCEATAADSHRAPKSGWRSGDGGTDPSPACTWNPGGVGENSLEGGAFVAPNLVGAELRQIAADGDGGDYNEGNRHHSLGTMLHLPTDEDYEDCDYH